MANKKYIIVKADTNDADYVTNKSLIDDENLKIVTDIINKVERQTIRYWDLNSKDWKERKAKRISWETGEMQSEPLTIQHPELTFEEIDFMEENYIPYGEYGIHTIESIEILEVVNEYSLL